jgi:hypothetical protein
MNRGVAARVLWRKGDGVRATRATCRWGGPSACARASARRALCPRGVRCRCATATPEATRKRTHNREGGRRGGDARLRACALARRRYEQIAHSTPTYLVCFLVSSRVDA